MVKLSPEQARKKCPDDMFLCSSTGELEALDEIIGQDRAVRALRFGLRMGRKGFNIYASGIPGTGKQTAIQNFVSEIAKDRPIPSDWCYVNNFQDQTRPKALQLPPGKGAQFKKDMDQFVSNLKKALSTAFESEEYGKRREQTLKAIEEEGNQLTATINSMAQQAGFILQRSPVGFIVVPVMRGQPLTDSDFAQLPARVQQELESRRQELQQALGNYMRQFRDLGKKADEAVRQLNRSVALYALEPYMSAMRENYGSFEQIQKYLRDVEEDVLANLSELISGEEQQSQRTPFPFPRMREDPTERYKVNLIVDNSGAKGAPVITEPNPTYVHLFGGTEKEARFGTLVTDYTMIRAGSAHQANGGFLIIPVEGLFTNPMVWGSLKRMIDNEKIEIEEPSEGLGLMITKSLRPDPIPYSGKIIVVGDPQVYETLYSLDKDFRELFKVKADFDTTMDRKQENVTRYASFICALCQKEELIHLDPSGIAAVVEYSSRLADRQDKLSTQFAAIADIIREACFYAHEEKAELVTRRHVEKALEEKVYRSNLIQNKLQEMIERRVLLVDVDGEKTGQVNGLSVLGLGDYMFGNPSRVTASVAVGREGIVDIEREAQMGGPIHTKGVLILNGYLNERYAQEKPLSLSARLVFEQSYSGVEGDSASSTELYALLSALSDKPIKQYLAVTGSVNQKGEVQAIGGVNEKIEGYYAVCKALGLNATQGVVIPASNVENLMLKEEIIESIKDDEFHIYAVKTIDEGIEILTGHSAGERLADGTYEPGTLNYLVQNRLQEMADKARQYYYPDLHPNGS